MDTGRTWRAQLMAVAGVLALAFGVAGCGGQSSEPGSEAEA